MSDGICRQYGDDYCKSNTCGVGDGDCDSDDECDSGLICASNKFQTYHPFITDDNSPGTPSTAEVCIPLRTISNSMHIVHLLTFSLSLATESKGRHLKKSKFSA